MKAIFVFLLLCSTSAFALDRLQTLSQENPNASPYELMKQLYDESTTPATVTDFDFSNVTPTLQKCALAGPETKRTGLVGTSIARYGITIDEAPSRGPLFPAVPGYTKDMNCLYPAATLDQFTADEMKSVCKDAKLSTTEKDLVWQINTHYECTPISLYMRKNGDLVSLRFIMKANKKQFVEYGYCYHEEPKPHG